MLWHSNQVSVCSTESQLSSWVCVQERMHIHTLKLGTCRNVCKLLCLGLFFLLHIQIWRILVKTCIGSCFWEGSSSQGLDPASPMSALISRARLSLIWPLVCQSPGLNWQLIYMLLSSHLLFAGWELNSTYSYHITMRNISCYSTGGTSQQAASLLQRNSMYIFNLAVSEVFFVMLGSCFLLMSGFVSKDTLIVLHF